jgi:hypothetical protein
MTGMITAAVVFLAAHAGDGRADVFSYTNLATFQSLVGPQATIGFTEVPLDTTLSDEYSSLGVRFVDGDDTTQFEPAAYLTDSFGLEGGPHEGQLSFIILQFASPVRSLGVDFPGALRIELFNGATSLGSSANFGSSGAGFFGGVISDAPFDRAVLSDWLAGDVYIDNLHVEPVPEPSTWALLAVASGVACCIWRKPKAVESIEGS